MTTTSTRAHVARLAVLATLALPARTALAQANPSSWARVDSAVADELRRTHTPGAAIALVSGDRVVYARGYGVADTATGAAVTPEMLFHIASVTKLFTAATLVPLAEEAHVDLAAPVGARIAEFPDAARGVSLHQLLSHTAGLSFGPIPPGGADPATALANAARLLPPRVAQLPPGEIFSYSNVGYLLAGRAAEVLGGHPYHELVEQRLLAPLAMRTATFDSASAARTGLARGYVEPTPVAAAPAPNGPETWPFAGLYTSAAELAHFAVAFMNEGRFEGRQVMSPATIARISAPVNPFVSGEGSYGYGVRVYEHRGVPVVEHGGRATEGYRSLLYMVPSRRVAVIVLANSSAGSRAYGVADAALDALLPGVVTPAVPPPSAVAMEAAEMAQYAGRYANGAAVEVTVDDGALVLHQGPAALPIRKLADGMFVAGPPQGGLRLAFVRGPDGAVRYLHYNMRAFRRL